MPVGKALTCDATSGVSRVEESSKVMASYRRDLLTVGL